MVFISFHPKYKHAYTMNVKNRKSIANIRIANVATNRAKTFMIVSIILRLPLLF